MDLGINVEQYGEVEGIEENIRYALSLNLEEVQQAVTVHDGTCVIVGSSPSLNSTIDLIGEERKKGRAICAINGAHDYLVENGIIPNTFLTIDPRVMCGVEPRPHVNNLRFPQKETIYLIASRAHPSTFDHLKDHFRLIWHCYSKEYEKKVIGKRMQIGGGTTSGLRAIPFFYLQGFRKFHLYGMDSCLGEKKEKRYNTGPLPKAVETQGVRVGNREFLCNIAMAVQADEFQETYTFLPDIHIEVFGGGLLAAIIEERKNQGMVT